MIRIVLLITILLNFSSCSFGEVAYRFGDWLIKREILSYVKLYQGQQQKLELELDEYMAWHKKVMMPKYANDLENLKTKIEATKFNTPESKVVLIEIFQLSRARYLESVMPLTERVSPILSTINDTQLQRSRELLAKKYQSIVDEKKKYTKEEAFLMWKENIETWIGPLTAEQTSWLKERQDDFYLEMSSKKRITERGHKQKTYLDIFDEENQSKRTERQLDFWQKFKKDFLKVNFREKTIETLNEFLGTLSKAQRDRLIARITYYQSIIKDIID